MSWGAAIGGAANIGGSFLGGLASKKAAKKRLKYLQDALKKYQAGSYDALGNKLSANNDGTWKYDLTYGSKQAKNAANKANIVAGTTPLKSSSEVLRDIYSANTNADNLVAKANQSAAMRSGARTNSNLGNIANSFSRQGSANLRNNYLNAFNNSKNPASYNAQIQNQLANYATNASSPINNIQRNLQNMVNSLNKTQMDQINKMAGAASDPYLYGQMWTDTLNSVGNTFSGIKSSPKTESTQVPVTNNLYSIDDYQLTPEQLEVLYYILGNI